MNVMILGGGDFGEKLEASLELRGIKVVLVSKEHVDLTSFSATVGIIEATNPDWVVCTAGMSDRLIGATIRNVVDANLVTAMHVGQAAAVLGIPCILVASTAGIDPGIHSWYGAAKAGVINFVRAMGAHHKIWALSPGRMDTMMRKIDWPYEDPDTRLNPGEVIRVVYDIMSGWYAPGANVVVRKVGVEGRIDVYEAAAETLPSML